MFQNNLTYDLDEFENGTNLTFPRNITVWTETNGGTFLDIYQTTSYAVFGLAAGVSSCFVMHVICMNKKLWKKFSMFFWLAASNLLSCIGMIVFSFVEFNQKFHTDLQIADHSECFLRLYPFMITIGRQTSSTIHLCLCIERVIAIGFPYKYNTYWTKRGKKIVHCFLLLSIAVSIVVAIAAGLNYEIPARWVCNPPSVFHPTYIKFQRYYPIICDGFCAILTLVLLYLYTNSKRDFDALKRSGTVFVNHLDPVINTLVFYIMLLTMFLGFIPDTVYLIWAPSTPSENEETALLFDIFSTFYQVLPFANFCSILLLNCWLVKDFRQSLFRMCDSSKTFVTDLRNDTKL